MAYRQTPFAPTEWYHCYSRSVDRKTVFETPQDYERFLQALYLCNNLEPVRRYNLRNPSHADLLQLERSSPIVAIGAYCLMPNHFHIVLQELVEGGISKFMHKVGTSFSMYFNIKHRHIGNVFIKPFRSKHIADDRYLKHVAQYVHLNPIELFEPKWKEGLVTNLPLLEKRLREYRHSSFTDYISHERAETVLLDPKAMKLLAELPPLRKILTEAAAYYRELPSV